MQTPDPHYIPPKVPDKQSDEWTSFKRQAHPLGGFSLELAVAFVKSGARAPPGAWGRRLRPGRVPPHPVIQGSQETSRIKHPNLSFLVVCLHVSEQKAFGRGPTRDAVDTLASRPVSTWACGTSVCVRVFLNRLQVFGVAEGGGCNPRASWKPSSIS